MSRARHRTAALDPATLARLARVEPGAADYITSRRRRGIPAQGCWQWGRA